MNIPLTTVGNTVVAANYSTRGIEAPMGDEAHKQRH